MGIAPFSALCAAAPPMRCYSMLCLVRSSLACPALLVLPRAQCMEGAAQGASRLECICSLPRHPPPVPQRHWSPSMAGCQVVLPQQLQVRVDAAVVGGKALRHAMGSGVKGAQRCCGSTRLVIAERGGNAGGAAQALPPLLLNVCGEGEEGRPRQGRAAWLVAALCSQVQPVAWKATSHDAKEAAWNQQQACPRTCLSMPPLCLISQNIQPDSPCTPPASLTEAARSSCPAPSTATAAASW